MSYAIGSSTGLTELLVNPNTYGKNPWTISLWYSGMDTNIGQAPMVFSIAIYGDNFPSHDIVWGFRSDGGINFAVSDQDFSIGWRDFSDAYAASGWHYIAQVCNGSTIQNFLDGVAMGYTYNPFGEFDLSGATNSGVKVRMSDDYAPDYTLGGLFVENVAINTDTITARYNNGKSMAWTNDQHTLRAFLFPNEIADFSTYADTLTVHGTPNYVAGIIPAS